MNENLLKSDVGIFTSDQGENTIIEQLADDITNFGANPINLKKSKNDKISSLILVSDNEFQSKDKVRALELLKKSLRERIPILCINWGMYLLNSFFGGRDPILIESNHHNGKELKHPVFISPGGKLSYTIGGSGWVTIPSNHEFALTHKQLSDELISTIYSEDRMLHGIELPGKSWVVGVQWQAHKIQNNPKGFDNLLRYISDKVEI